MIGRRRAVAVAAVAVAWVLAALGVGAASAAPADDLSGSLSNVRVVDGRLSFTFIGTTGEGLGNEVDLRTTGGQVALVPSGGRPALRLDPVVTPLSQGKAPTYMLVLDVSASMRANDKFQQEQQKALDFLAGVDAGAKVGLTVFGSPARTILAPTADLAEVTATIQGLQAGKGATDLYTAVTSAAKEFPPDDSLSLMVMVTDGNDYPGARYSGAKNRDERLAEARDALSKNGIRFVGLVIGEDAATSNLAEVVKGYPAGQVLGADVADTGDALEQLFSGSKSSTDKAVGFSAVLPPSVSFTGSVSIEATALERGGRTVRGEATTLLLSTPRATPSSATTALRATPMVGRRSPITAPVLIGALGALFLAMVVLIVSATGAVTAAESKESEVTRRLSFYTLAGNRLKPTLVKEEPTTRLAESRIARSAINLVNRVARQRKLDKALDTRLEAAGLPIRTAEWTLLHLGSAVGGALLLLVAARGMLIGAILGLALGLVLPWMFLGLRTSLRERKFLAQLPDTLQLLAGSLAAGYSLPQAMDAVLRESQAPISVEFNRALIETRLGMPPEDALEGIAARTGSKDFSWVVMAIRIQREVGGNLAELLSSVADTLRERERLRRQVSALSAEGRLSGIILGALPVLFALFLIFTKPEYIAPLFEQRIGIMLLITGTVLLLAGSFWMSRLVKVEV